MKRLEELPTKRPEKIKATVASVFVFQSSGIEIGFKITFETLGLTFYRLDSNEISIAFAKSLKEGDEVEIEVIPPIVKNSKVVGINIPDSFHETFFNES